LLNDLSGALFHPSLNLSKFSDEELTVKLNELSKRLAFASTTFLNQEVISQLHNLINVLVTEQSERIEKERYALLDSSSPKIIETEPDLKEIDLKKTEPVKRDDSKKRTYVPIILKHWKKPLDGTT
jgi:hypothetical protein